MLDTKQQNLNIASMSPGIKISLNSTELFRSTWNTLAKCTLLRKDEPRKTRRRIVWGEFIFCAVFFYIGGVFIVELLILISLRQEVRTCVHSPLKLYRLSPELETKPKKAKQLTCAFFNCLVKWNEKPFSIIKQSRSKKWKIKTFICSLSVV